MNELAEVLDAKTETPVPGLYACGEVAAQRSAAQRTLEQGVH